MKQQLKQTQRQIMAPQLRQSLFILSLPMQRLREIAVEEMNKNPVLEDAAPIGSAKSQSLKQPALNTFSSEFSPREKRSSKTDSLSNLPQQGDISSTLTKPQTLHDVLSSQLGIHFSAHELEIGQEIIGNIDENGYLKEPVERIAKSLEVDISAVEKILAKIQEFEPRGAGARDLKECLLIQTHYAYPGKDLIREIIQKHLADLGKKKYELIAKKLKMPLEEIKHAVVLIQKLEPKPGRNFSVEEAQRIIPDAIITKSDDGITLQIKEAQAPKLRISQQYKDLLNDPGTDQKTKDFIREQIVKAQDFIRAIEQRHTTIQKVISLIVKIQGKALTRGMKYLKPLKLQDIAGKLNLHQTTISRVIMHKYIQTPFGSVPLKDLFSGGIETKSGKIISSKNVKLALAEIINKENRQRPLNDDAITSCLNKALGISICRRTVVKYRKQLKILSSFYRRQGY